MDNSRFDALARSLAHGTTRRRVLGMLGGAVAGALGFGRVSAQNECSAFCQSLPPGPQRGQCRAACAHGTGPFYDCEGDSSRLCIAASGEATCCPAGVPCVDGICDVAPPPPGCTVDSDCDDGDPCTTDVCESTGVCSNTPIAGCGEPSTCTCDLAQNGQACTSSEECCSGYCNGAFCDFGEGCVGAGSFCEDGSVCCSGLCGEDCRCTCLASGDMTCSENNQCCGGICGPNGCCGDVDTLCASGSECCSGICTDGACDRGPSGTPCDSAGACQSIECCEGVCCPENQFCGETATGGFACMSWE